MQSLHPFRGSIQEYLQELSDPNRYRPDHCPLCQGRDPLRAHGFYCRTLVDVNYDGAIPVRRYLCLLCKRTVSLLPEFALPYLRFSIQVIGLFLVSRLLYRRTFKRSGCRGLSTQHALSTRPVLGTPIPAANRVSVRRFGQLNRGRAGDRFSDPRVTDAGGHWLDRSASFPVRRTPGPLAGLATFSGSPRLSHQPLAGSSSS